MTKNILNYIKWITTCSSLVFSHLLLLCTKYILFVGYFSIQIYDSMKICWSAPRDRECNYLFCYKPPSRECHWNYTTEKIYRHMRIQNIWNEQMNKRARRIESVQNCWFRTVSFKWFANGTCACYYICSSFVVAVPFIKLDDALGHFMHFQTYGNLLWYCHQSCVTKYHVRI